MIILVCVIFEYATVIHRKLSALCQVRNTGDLKPWERQKTNKKIRFKNAGSTFLPFFQLFQSFRNWEIKLQLKRGDCVINGAYNSCTVKLVYRLAVHILKESKT